MNITSIEKAIEVLRFVLHEHKYGVRLVDIHTVLKLPKTTAYRITKQLEESQLIARNEKTKKFHLGPFAEELGHSASQQAAMSNQYQRLIQSIADKTGDATFLVVQQGLDTLCVARAIGSFPIQALTIPIGNRQPIGIGAGGLAMLAAMEQQSIEDLLAKNEQRIKNYGGMTKKKLLALVKETQNKGYAVIGSYAVKDVTGVGVVLRDKENNIIAGISSATLSHRMTKSHEESLAKTIREEIGGI